ncbi:hypothetical protein A3H74_00285 [Candidatus Kaiserbacteria bacterium RIFCSPLOWO2_02_FULL_51_13]|nr:MAG: hypothetical protein A3H74_00285 [Candidatus Kaiserbacteria bacterium RIFCSPLOWO2_02_FULL_51_13]
MFVAKLSKPFHALVICHERIMEFVNNLDNPGNRFTPFNFFKERAMLRRHIPSHLRQVTA